MLTAEYLRYRLHYNPLTGVFTWRNGRFAGRRAGYVTPQGYRVLMLKGRIWGAGRLAWLYTTGAWPPAVIDHRNHIKDDDRWDNLRAATYRENALNLKEPWHGGPKNSLRYKLWACGKKTAK